MDEVLKVQLLGGEEYATRRAELGKAALAGELTLAMAEEAMAYGFKSEGKKARFVNLGFECFLRYFENLIPVAGIGTLYGFLCRARRWEGVGGELFHYKILRHLSKEERCRLFIEGVLHHGITPPKPLADWTHIAKISGEEFSDWVVGLIEAYEDKGQLLSGEHPLVMVLKYGAGQNFGSDMTPWWEPMSSLQVRKAIWLIASKRPDVLFASRKALTDRSRQTALRYMAPVSEGEIALGAARKMPSFARINVDALFSLIPTADMVALLDRLSPELPGFALCKALEVAMARGEVQHAMAVAQHLPKAIIFSELPVMTKLYQSSYGFGPEWGQLGEVVRRGLMQAFRCHWVSGSLCSDGGQQELSVIFEGHWYFPCKGDTDLKPGEVVLFKPAAPGDKAHTMHHAVAMHRLSPERA